MKVAKQEQVPELVSELGGKILDLLVERRSPPAVVLITCVTVLKAMPRLLELADDSDMFASIDDAAVRGRILAIFDDMATADAAALLVSKQGQKKKPGKLGDAVALAEQWAQRVAAAEPGRTDVPHDYQFRFSKDEMFQLRAAFEQIAALIAEASR